MKIKLGERQNWLLPRFFTSSVAPHSPQVSTIACPRIYAAATNAVGQIVSGEAAENATLAVASNVC